MKSFSLLILFYLIFSMPLSGQEASGDPVSVAESETDETLLLFEEPDSAVLNPELEGSINSISVWTYVYVILVLVGVILLIYFIFFLLKKSGMSKSPDLNLIQLHSTKMLAGNRSLHLIEVANKMMIVGSSENSVNLISEITEQETIDTIRVALSEQDSPKGGFKEIFSDLFKPAAMSRAGDEDKLSTDFISKQRERLKEI